MNNYTMRNEITRNVIDNLPDEIGAKKVNLPDEIGVKKVNNSEDCIPKPERKIW